MPTRSGVPRVARRCWLSVPAAPSGLKKARESLRTSFPAELYGEGNSGLAAAVVETLERCDRLLVCSDPAAGAFLETRLETVPGAEKVFDFGTLSYAHPRTGPQIEKRALARLHLPAGCAPDPLRLALARAQSARKIVGAELAAGCAEREHDRVLILSTRRGCWLRTVREEDIPALWLLDMIRRGCRRPSAGQRHRLFARHAEHLNPTPCPQRLRRAALRPEHIGCGRFASACSCLLQPCLRRRGTGPAADWMPCPASSAHWISSAPLPCPIRGQSCYKQKIALLSRFRCF